MQDQAVRPELHERQRAQHVEGIVRGYVRQQRREEGKGRPAQRAGGVEHGPGALVEPGKVDPGEFADDGGDRGVGDRYLRAGVPRGGGQPQGQWVAVGEPGDPGGVGFAESFAAQQRIGAAAARFASGTVVSMSPKSVIQAVTGGSRPASASLVLSRRPGTSSCRSQVSSNRSCS